MENKLHIYNTLSRKKEEFNEITPGKVGMYVCGPTVYGDAHLGHARFSITFDLLFRYLKYLGYKVRYVRNITDVGHLVNDADEGEDKIAKKARLEEIEPMEVVQHYTYAYHTNMRQLNCESPSIEPRASGHIIEQQELIQKIIDEGFAYESNGSVYFDVKKYNETNDYGKLSGRVIEELLENTRALDGQNEKCNSFDFALWKKATPEHIMRWPSKWSDGFPGWHLECSAMSRKYLGDKFDIHGGGMDLKFPHHECEIAQTKAAYGHESVNYWMHNNMITINGQKMGRSLNNFITLDQLFAGDHHLLEMPYDPTIVRFFILRAHYRSSVDFSNEALQASEVGLKKIFAAISALDSLKTSDKTSFDLEAKKANCFEAMNDDLNTPILISHLFDIVKVINSIKIGNETITEDDLKALKEHMHGFVFDVLGLKMQADDDKSMNVINQAMDLLMEVRQGAKEKKDWATADLIRNKLKESGVVIKDTKDGVEWSIE